MAAVVSASQPQQQAARRTPWLGVPLGTPEPQVLTELGLPAGRGAGAVTFVRDPNLPRIDLDPGDIIIAIDGTMVEGPGHVDALLATRNPGSIVRVTVLRRSLGRQTEQPMVIFDGTR
jgi:S1-C subfamily serine protease